MAVPGQVKTNKNKSSTKKTMGEGATEASKVGMSMLIPVVGLKAVSAAIATKGVAFALKKFGPNLVKSAKKYLNPVKTQKMKTGKGRGVSGNKKEMEDAYVVYKKGPLSKNKKGDVDMGMKKVTKAQGERMLAQGAARKVGLATIAAEASILTGSALSRDKKEPKGTPATVTPNQKSRQADLSETQKVTQTKDIGDGDKKSKKSKDSIISKSAESKPKPPRPRNKDVEGIATAEKKIASKKAAQDLATQEKRSAKKPTTTDVGEQVSKKKTAKKKDMSDPKKAKGYDYGSKDDDFKFEADDLNLRKGGMAKYKKGGMARAFGMGGMYKTPKKTYGMKYGGMTKKRGRA
tara:strand:+ start:47 stop:1090 length:1044 start_codon:yes stop_codon:yes gene_type:complete